MGHPLLETGRPVHAAVHFGQPAREIISFAKKGQFDLIILATHGRSRVIAALPPALVSQRDKQNGSSLSADMNARVLLVDDHHDVRTSLAQRLQRDRRLELVGAAARLEEAAELLRKSPADVVLLDIHRHDGHGLEVCRALHALTDAPVVLFTSFMTPELWAAGREAGAAGVLLKHIDTDRLGLEILRVAEQHRGRSQPDAP